MARLLDQDLAVTFGREDRSHRILRLFYSIADNSCFVAVQDERNGEVVTILTLEFCRFPISMEAREEAERLALGIEPNEPASEQTDRTSESNSGIVETDESAGTKSADPALPSVLRFSCRSYRDSDGYFRTVNIGTLPIAEYGTDLAAAAISPVVHAKLRRWLAVKLRPGEVVISYTVRLGGKGEPYNFPPLGNQ